MDDPTARRILDIGPYATREQARAAYKRRAKIIHPDRYADASESTQRDAARAMAELNEAWRSLRLSVAPRTDGVPETASRDADEHGAAQRDQRDRPHDTGCEICGHTPAIWIDLRALTGLLILHRSDRYAATLCKDCGTATWRDVQAQTLTLGWWGIPALFANLAVLVNNRSYGVALRELTPPQTRVVGSPAPMAKPIPVTKPVTARLLPWLATITAVMLLVLLVIAAVQVRT